MFRQSTGTWVQIYAGRKFSLSLHFFQSNFFLSCVENRQNTENEYVQEENLIEIFIFRDAVSLQLNN